MNNLSFIKKAMLAFKFRKTAFNIAWNSLNKNSAGDYPETIGIELTSKCNLTCSMCHNADLREGHNKQYSRVTLEQIEQLLPELKKYKPIVSLSGGEPMLHNDLFKIIRLLSDNDIMTTISTNGTLIKRRVDQIIDSKLAFMSVSLDHFVPELHDKGRGKAGTFADVVEGLKLLVCNRKYTPYNIKINTVITEDNFDSLPQLYSYIESLGIDEWRLAHFCFLTPQMRTAVDESKSENGFSDPFYAFDLGREALFDDSQIATLIKGIREIKKLSLNYKTKLSLPALKEEDYYPYYKGVLPSEKSSCNFPIRGLYIHSGGKASTCVMDLGDLSQEHSIKRIWSSKTAVDFRKLQKEQKIFPHCARCSALSFNFEKK